MKNDKNNFAKRTAAQVNAILAANGILHKAENLGDGNTFQIAGTSDIKTRVALKQAGFILLRSNAGDITLTFKTN